MVYEQSGAASRQTLVTLHCYACRGSIKIFRHTSKFWRKASTSIPVDLMKDRPALSMIREGERSGKLRPGMTIIDATSGNTGIAYAMIGACSRYPVTVCLPKNADLNANRSCVPMVLKSLRRIKCFPRMALNDSRVSS